MARIAYATRLNEHDLAGLDAAARFRVRMDAVWAHRPALKAAWDTFGAAVAAQTQLPPRLVELVRLRIAFHNQCRSCMAMRYQSAVDDGLTEALVCSLESPEEADDLSEAERAALRFADLFATDHLAISDATIDNLRRYFDEGSIFELLFRCARMTGFGRMAAVLAVYDDLGDASASDGDTRYAPWQTEVTLPGNR